MQASNLVDEVLYQPHLVTCHHQWEQVFLSQPRQTKLNPVEFLVIIMRALGGNRNKVMQQTIELVLAEHSIAIHIDMLKEGLRQDNHF